MALEYEKLLSQHHLQAEITHTKGSGETWIGLMEDPATLSGSAEYVSPWEALGDSLNDTLNSAGILAGSFGANTVSDALAGRIKSIKQTVLVWRGSPRPSYAVSFTLFSHDGRDVTKEAYRLYSYTMPKQEGAYQISAPGGYKVTDGGATATGTWSIRYGSWFKAHDLVLDSVTITPSTQQVTTDGANAHPLYVNVTAQLTPVHIVHQADALGYYTL